MAPSTSSGKQSNRDTLPYEHRGRMTWDPEYKDKHRDDISSSGSDNNDDYSDNEYPSGPYISGGLSTGQPTPNGVSPRPGTSAAVQRNLAPGDRGRQRTLDLDGFQRVLHRMPQRHPKSCRPRFAFNRDNAAKAAFRKRHKHSGQYILPRAWQEIEPSQAKMIDYLEEVGVRLCSFIRPPQEIGDRTLLLWGNDEQIGRTTKELHSWVSSSLYPRVSNSKAKDKFASVNSSIGDKYKRVQKKIKEEADVRKFQQEPAIGITFKYTGSFLWPADEIAPTDLLGASLEAMDPLRINFKCHITFDARLSVIKILTNNAESVKQAFARIQGIMKEYVARVNRPIVRYYIEPPGPSAYREDIQKMSSQKLIPNSGSAFIPSMTGTALEASAQGTWLRQMRNLKAQSDRGIHDALSKAIPSLRFYRGQVRIRVHFGTFALTLFRWPGAKESIRFEDFMKNLAMPNTKGTMLRDLQYKEDAFSIVNRTYNANTLFQPIDNYTEFLKDTPLSFGAYFICQEHDKEPVKLQVEMIGNAIDTNLHEKTHASWSRLGSRANVIPLDVFMIRLDGGTSWGLQASAETTIDRTRITPKMVEFAESVKLKRMPKRRVDLTGEKVFEWDKTPGSMMVTEFHQKTSLRFRLVRNMDYLIEISRYDSCDHPITNDQRQTTNWAATLWNAEWDSELMANTALEIGQSATWEPTLGTFFPNPSGAATPEGGISEGVKEFLEIASEVNDFLNEIKK